MRFYHYSTWEGRRVHEEGIIKPSRIFMGDLFELCPPLVFLTTDDYWEPSIQAATENEDWSKGPSDPKWYTSIDIPCWRFAVNIDSPYTNLIYTHPDWIAMMEDAQELGSDLSQWHWTTKPCIVQQASLWQGDRWVIIL